MEYIVGIIITLLGYGYYQKQKRNSAEAINTNVDSREEIQKTQANVDKNSASIDAEEAKRNELKEQGNEKSNLSLTDLLAFFTKR